MLLYDLIKRKLKSEIPECAVFDITNVADFLERAKSWAEWGEEEILKISDAIPPFDDKSIEGPKVFFMEFMNPGWDEKKNYGIPKKRGWLFKPSKKEWGWEIKYAHCDLYERRDGSIVDGSWVRTNGDFVFSCERDRQMFVPNPCNPLREKFLYLDLNLTNDGEIVVTEDLKKKVNEDITNDFIQRQILNYNKLKERLTDQGKQIFDDLLKKEAESGAQIVGYNSETVVGQKKNETYLDVLSQNLTECLQALMFMAMHSSCVERVELQAPRYERRQALREGKPPLTKFYVLDVHGMGSKSSSKIGSGISSSKSFAIVRGHRKKYTGPGPEHLLFGKYKTTIYVPAHTSGDKEVGEVKKMYQVSCLK